jgi:hypothetical protein
MGVFLPLSACGRRESGQTDRKAGKRPKKAINVTSDTVTVKAMMLRASVMVKGDKWRNVGRGTLWK